VSECPNCLGKGFIITKEPKKIYLSEILYYIKGWIFVRKKCERCDGRGIIHHWAITLQRAVILEEECLSGKQSSYLDPNREKTK
jgi:formate dehydrogenase maturation protein FdhE